MDIEKDVQKDIQDIERSFMAVKCQENAGSSKPSITENEKLSFFSLIIEDGKVLEPSKASTNTKNEKKEKKSKDFRLFRQVLLLTYPTFLDKKELEAFLRLKIRNLHDIIIGWETGETGYKHTHVCVHTSGPRVRFDIKGQSTLDFKGIHGEYNDFLWKFLADKWNYCCKDDPANQDKKKQTNLVTSIMGCDSTLDALEKHCEKPADAMGVIMIHKFKKMDYRTKFTDANRPWQLELRKEVKEECENDREVIWLWDPIGKCGKRVMGDWLSDNYPGWFYINSWKGCQRVIHLVLKMCRAGLRPKGFFINISREGFHEGIYDFIEQCKDGMLIDSMYDGDVVRFDPCWVIISSNFEPEWSKLSSDRWDVRRFCGKAGAFQRVASNTREKPLSVAAPAAPHGMLSMFGVAVKEKITG